LLEAVDQLSEDETIAMLHMLEWSRRKAA